MSNFHETSWNHDKWSSDKAEQMYIFYQFKTIWLWQPTVLNLKKLFDTFVQLGLKIIYAKFHEDRTEYVACENVHLILTSFKMAVKFLGLQYHQTMKNKFAIHLGEETFSIIAPPPRCQRSFNVLGVPRMISWLYIPSLVKILYRVAEKWAYILFGDLLNAFVCHGLMMIWAMFQEE